MSGVLASTGHQMVVGGNIYFDSINAAYERNTEKVEEAVKKINASYAQAVIMISVNKSTAAFVKTLP